MDSLRKLNLTGNNIPIIYELSTFTGLNALRELYLDNNDLQTLVADIFKEVPNLEVLSLNGNRINLADDGIFNGLANLRQLHLKGSLFSYLEPDTFRDLHNLTHLYLQDNKILYIDTKSFKNLTKLEELYLDNNRVTDLRPGMFTGLGSLKVLSLAGNRIAQIKKNCLKDLRKLEHLFLDNNDLIYLTSGMFTGLESLQVLNINNNSIASVEKETFAGLNNLKYLEMNFNNLGKIQDGMFEGLNSIHEIGICPRNNKLTTIPCAQFASLPRPIILDISGNPLICDSSLCWLRQEVDTGSIKWLQETEENQTFPIGHVFKPTCADGMNWNDVSWSCAAGDDNQRCSSSSHITVEYFVSGAMFIMTRILVQ